MSWSAYLIRTASGQIGPQVGVSSASWSIPLNDTETAKIGLIKSSLPRFTTQYWLEPWWGGILLMWNDVPIFAGPIIGRPSEGFTEVSVDCSGIRSLLARRFVTPELQDWTTLSSQVISYSGLALSTIMKNVVQVAMSKPGGSLPISFPIPDATGPNDDIHVRTYRSFNISNLNCDDVLTKLSNVINGPDVIFRPRLLDASKFVWDMWTGTELQPRISQNMTPVWDTTADQGSVTDMSVTMTGAYQASRVYSIGAGQDEGTLIRVVEDLTPTAVGYPLLEIQIKTGDSEDPNVVSNWGTAKLNANKTPIAEVSMNVRADGIYPLGQFWVGNQIEFYSKGWLSLTDGVHKARLLNISGDLTEDVKLSMQTES